MDGLPVPFTGNGGVGNEFIDALLHNPQFIDGLAQKYGFDLTKADTISQATNLLWYDLSPLVQMLYPYRELIPRISRLARVPGDGGTAFHEKRIVGVNVNGVSSGVGEGNRGARIAIAEQDMMYRYSGLGYESSVSFEARYGGRNLSPETLGLATQSSLRSLMIDEEKLLVNGNGTFPLGTTPTPTIRSAAVAGVTGVWSGATAFVIAVALTGMGRLGYSTYNPVTNLGGVPGQVTKTNADQSVETYGGGSARPSAEASLLIAGTNCAVVNVTPVPGAYAYAWYASTSSGTETLIGLTPSNQVILTGNLPSSAQPIGNLYISGTPTDNSVNQLVPDGILNQIAAAITGPDPGRIMATNTILPNAVSTGDTITTSPSGALVYTMATGNVGLTPQGSNFPVIDVFLQAAYDQYKIGFDRMLISAADNTDTFGAMLGQSASASPYRIWFDADQATGRIVAGRRVTAYQNKSFGNDLDVEIHPYVPPGTIIFWSDRSPYELSGVANLIEARVRQDYYQIPWPWRTRRYEYGVYVDETFPCKFTPAFGLITNKNPVTGSFVY